MIFASGKKSLGQEEREAHKILSLHFKEVLPLYAKGTAHILKAHKKIPTFPLTVIHVTVLLCERASCTLLKTRKGYVPRLSS